jgi:hypothetical protein
VKWSNFDVICRATASQCFRTHSRSLAIALALATTIE